ncbi:MAG: mercuric reductase [Cytophagaceae bacterium]|nr:mercuric reductase [Gemmatimonadaceae bacterium]
MAPSNTSHYDAILLGSGQGGTPLAGAFAKAGRRTLLIDRLHVGGTCINEGCTPTKTMVASARVAYLARRGADYGVHGGPISVDQARVRERKRAIVESFRGGSEDRLVAAGVEVQFGQGRFVAPRTLEITTTDGTASRVSADVVVISTGLRNAPPDIAGLDTVTALDNVSIMELDRAPEHLVVIGAGYVGLEFAQMFRRFGSTVTVVGRGPALLGREDADIADALLNILREDGIEFHLDTNTRSVATGPGGGIRLTVQRGEITSTIDGSHLLLAAGRRPNTDDLDAAAGGVNLDSKGFVVVSPTLETSAAGTYAIGDVKGGPAFTHIAYDDFRILNHNLLNGGSATTTDRLLPYTVFTDPQLGRVGMTEQEAREAGRDVRVATMPMSHVARAIEMDETRGFMKAIVDTKTNRILGAAVLGLEGGELATVLQVAMMGGLPYTALRDTVFSHPTMAESLNNLFAALDS